MRRALVLAVALAAVFAVTAAAQRGAAFSVPVEDRQGDAGKGLDVVEAALGRDNKGRIDGRVRMAKAWGAADLRNDGAVQGSVCLRLYIANAADAEPPDYLVCATAPAEGDKLVGRVLRDQANGLPATVAKARLTRPDKRTVRLRFSQKSVGKPERLRFGGEAVKYGAGCRSPLGCRDMAPDAPNTIGIRLR
jgi:hypothetical protein